MPDLPRIPTPMAQHLQRIRYQLVPVMTFCLALAGVTWLWDRHNSLPDAIGEVQPVRLDLACQQTGRLVALPGRPPIELYQSVAEDQVVARLDDAPALALLETLSKELERLQKELAATEATIRQDQSERLDSQLSEQRRLMVDVERLRLEILDRQALLETDRVALLRHDELLRATQELVKKEVETPYTLLLARTERDIVQERINGNQRAMAELIAQRDASVQRLKEFGTSQPAAVDVLLQPVRAAISGQEARMREVLLQIQSLEVRSPIAGTICAVYCYPGQVVQAGAPVVAVASREGRNVVSYIRQHYRVQPQVNMTVDVRSRSTPAHIIKAQIGRVGPQVELVPPHQLADPKILEWGVPVFITVPSETSFRPGELVDISFNQ